MLRQNSTRSLMYSWAIAALLAFNLFVAPAWALDYDKRILIGHDFANQNLTDSSFDKANLRESNFSHANLQGVRFFAANLESANLEGANLSYAILDSARLTRANLTNAVLEGRLQPVPGLKEPSSMVLTLLMFCCVEIQNKCCAKKRQGQIQQPDGKPAIRCIARELRDTGDIEISED